MSLERFKTQVLLLHSEQSTLDNLSSGINDHCTVHFATTGGEALNTLGETQIDVIVSAQKLPGMSGLEALREAKKRSPDTIGILLAGDDNDGLEALVGDQEVFQVVRGSVTSDSLQSLIDNATRQARLLALAESANDTSANPDEPMGEHIVMETSENGSTIISDGTGRMPALDPQKISARADLGASAVDVLVVTQDDEFLGTVRESARGLHHVVYANTLRQADDAVRKRKIGVAVVDAAMVGTDVEKLTLHLRSISPRLVAIVAGRRDDGEMLMDLINRGRVYRFLLKPVSPGRSRLAIEASVKHHLEAPDSTFARGGKPEPAPKLLAIAAGKPKAPLEPAPKQARKLRPPEPGAAAPTEAKLEPETRRKPAATPKASTETRPPAAVDRPKITASESPPNASPSPSSIGERASSRLATIDDGLGDAFGGKDKGISQTVTGLVRTVCNRIASRDAGARKAPAADEVVDNRPAHTATARPGSSLLGKPALLAIGSITLVAIIGVSLWFYIGSTTFMPAEEPYVGVPSITEVDPNAGIDVPAEPLRPDLDELLKDARLAAESGQIVEPDEESALELYVTAREALPGNSMIEAELAMVIGKALGLAETAMLERRLADAEAILARIAIADPDNPRLPFLGSQLAQMRLREHLDAARAAVREARFEEARIAIEAARDLAIDDAGEIDAIDADLNAALSDQRVDEVLGAASTRLEEGKLIAPINDNARYYYELALSNDPDNTVARQGLVTIASKLILRARAEIDQNRFDVAESLIADARRLDPSSEEVKAAASVLGDAQQRYEAEQREAARRAAERARAERAAAEKAAVERAAAERQAAQRAAAAEKLAVEQLATARPSEAKPAPPQTTAEPSSHPAAEVADPAPQPSETATDHPAPQRVAIDTPASAQPRAQQLPADNTPPQQTPADEAADGAIAAMPGPNAPVSASSLNRTKYVAPRYPRSAMRRGISGWVDVVFTVDIDGTVADVEILNSDAGDTFAGAATKAVSGWEFEPVIEDGVAIRKRAAVRMMFALE